MSRKIIPATLRFCSREILHFLFHLTLLDFVRQVLSYVTYFLSYGKEKPFPVKLEHCVQTCFEVTSRPKAGATLFCCCYCYPPLPSNDMAEDHAASEVGQLPKAWSRVCTVNRKEIAKKRLAQRVHSRTVQNEKCPGLDDHRRCAKDFQF